MTKISREIKNCNSDFRINPVSTNNSVQCREKKFNRSLISKMLFSFITLRVYRQLGDFFPRRCAVGGSASLRKCQLGELPVGGCVRWGKCRLVDLNFSDFLVTTFILIHFYLINATNENLSPPSAGTPNFTFF